MVEMARADGTADGTAADGAVEGTVAEAVALCSGCGAVAATYKL